MADLPFEILVHHIFTRLTVKPLFRFKCVCWAWYRILSDPQFVRLHLQQQQSCQKLLVLVNPGSPSFQFQTVDYEAAASSSKCNGADAVELHLQLERAPSKVPKILGSCNGLVFLKFSERFDHKRIDLLLWNPSIGDSKLIPYRSPTHDDYNLLGFGYDSSLDDFKIVRIIINAFVMNHDSFSRFNNRQKESQVDVYTLKTNSWEPTGDAPINLDMFRANEEGCFVNGSIYWLVFDRSRYGNCLGIVSFDLKDNKFGDLQLPSDLEPQHEPALGLKVLGGCLGMYHFSVAGKLIVWTIKEGKKEGWIKLMSLHTSRDSLHSPVCLMKNGKILISHFEKSDDFVHRQSCFALYDPKTNNKEDFHIRRICDSGYRVEVTYIESLVFPSFFEGC
ncbi:hypothetical protein LguiB_014603 [Lonicera macranthoides]